AACTAEFSAARIVGGPATVEEMTRMVVTSALIPPVATMFRLHGLIAHRHSRRSSSGPAIQAVVLDRDGTIIEDVPYNADPRRVRPAKNATVALERLRRRGLAVLIASNQSGVARGLLTRADVERVNERVAEILGP